MKNFTTTVFGTMVGMLGFFVALFLFFIVYGLLAGLSASFQPKDQYVLNLDLRGGVMDHSAGENLFGSTPLNTVDIVRTLHQAKDDKHVKGLFIRANSFGMTPATAEEIRLAVEDFKTGGKFVVAYAQGFEGTGYTNYLAVSAADEIWQQATTGFAVAGLRSETGFYKGLLDKIDAKPQIEQFYEYKNAANVYNETGYTDAHREATVSLLTSLYDTATSQIAEDRGMSVEAVKTAFEASPHSAEKAKELGFTDTLGHYQEAKDYVRKKAGGDKIKFKSLADYELSDGSGPVIAFVGGQGAVVNGSSSDGSGPFNNSVTMGGDTVAAAIHKAAKDKAVKAIVFRVSSPGGSPSASDQINYAVEQAKEAGKPVVISMGQYAASGGYYVSAKADKIVALPTTITGSIGVLGGKVALKDSFAKVGYNVDGITVGGDYAGAYSGAEPFNQSQLAAYRGQLLDIYNDFTELVAEGRDLPLERVKEIAKGRVWTGEQAKELGLVDEEGGILKAIDVAKELAEIDADKSISLRVFPRPKTPAQQLEELLSASAQAQDNLAAMQEIAELPEVQAVLKARNRLQPGQELYADLPEFK